MKTLIILLISLATTFSSYATGIAPIETSVEGKKITIFFDYAKEKTLEISIIDKYGFELLNEEVQTKNRKSRRYDLKNLPFGVYTFTIDSDQKIISKKIKIDRSNSTVISEETSYKPTTSFENNKWLVNLLALGQDVDVKIYDDEYTPVYIEKFENEMVLAKSYDLSKLEYGVYTLSVSVGDKSYNKVIAKM